MRYNATSVLEQKNKRWHPDSNWGMEALQASALPLGYATVFGFFYEERALCAEPYKGTMSSALRIPTTAKKSPIPARKQHMHARAQ